MFSVISGLIFMVWSHIVFPILVTTTGYLGVAAVYGMWFVGGTLTGYIIRKPGAAFLGELIRAHVELLSGSPFSIFLVYYGASQGIMSELRFAMFKYKKWDYKVMMIAGCLPALAAFPIDYYVTPEYQYYTLANPTFTITLLILYVVSGAILGGALVKWIVDRAVKAGALRGWPVAEE